MQDQHLNEIASNLDDLNFDEVYDPLAAKKAKVSKDNAKSAEIVAKYQKQMDRELQAHNLPKSKGVITQRQTLNTTTPLEYRLVFRTCIHLIKNKHLTLERGFFKAAWCDLHNHPYQKKFSQRRISHTANGNQASYKDQLLRTLKEQGIPMTKKESKFSTVSELMSILHVKAKDAELADYKRRAESAESRLKSYDFIVNNESANIIYRGVEIKKTSRHFVAKTDIATFKIPHAAVDRLVEVFNAIDAHLLTRK